MWLRVLELLLADPPPRRDERDNVQRIRSQRAVKRAGISTGNCGDLYAAPCVGQLSASFTMREVSLSGLRYSTVGS